MKDVYEQVQDLMKLFSLRNIARQCRMNNTTLSEIAQGIQRDRSQHCLDSIDAVWQKHCADMPPVDTRTYPVGPLRHAIERHFYRLEADAEEIRSGTGGSIPRNWLARLKAADDGRPIDAVKADHWAVELSLLPWEIWPEYLVLPTEDADSAENPAGENPYIGALAP